MDGHHELYLVSVALFSLYTIPLNQTINTLQFPYHIPHSTSEHSKNINLIAASSLQEFSSCSSQVCCPQISYLPNYACLLGLNL